MIDFTLQTVFRRESIACQCNFGLLVSRANLTSHRPKRLSVYKSLLRPLLFSLPPETAHELALHTLSISPGLIKTAFRQRGSFGELKRFGLTFDNPVGLAAGFDKNGIALRSLAALGFGFIEAGTVTLQPQPGNPKPRLFRLPLDRALLNRAGFNNEGAARFVERVSNARPDCVLGVSIGKSKSAPMDQAIDDYLGSFKLVHRIADYIAVNVSSPNTPGLRDLQQADQLDELLRALQQENLELSGESPPVPLLVKLAPDLHEEDLAAIVEVIENNGIAGIIATNTSVSRAGLRTAAAEIESMGAGGLSGAPLRTLSTRFIARLFQLTGGSVPLVGVGGIFNAEDAWEKICAGASLVQLYTGFIYEGPGIVTTINDGLHQQMLRAGFQSLDEAVGCRAGEFLG